MEKSSRVARFSQRHPILSSLICTTVRPSLWRRTITLDPDVTDFDAIRDILKPYDANLMRRYPVSRKLNNSRIDDAESASRVTLDTPTQARLF